MSRADGSGRCVSADNADDTGTRILHVDMDAFYASVEVLDDPSLAGIPLIVGATGGRGVVAAASYEARKFGIRSAMPVGQAVRLCPTVTIVPPRFERYVAISRQVMDIFEQITPLVEPLSIDEAFLDVSGARRVWGSPGRIAVSLRRTVRETLGLTCSVGVAATKHVAKIASTLSKPDGLLIIPPAREAEVLGPLPVRTLWGVGPRAEEALHARGIRTIADVRAAAPAVLTRSLGAAMGERVGQLARGLDPRDVQTERVEKSIGHEETFLTDVSDDDVLRAEVRRLADRVGERVRAHGWVAGVVSITVRWADFTTITRSHTLPEPTAVSQRIGDAALGLFSAIERPMPVRLVGVRAEKLRRTADTAAPLWDDDAEWRVIETAVDGAKARFGGAAITRASTLGASPRGPRGPSGR